MFELYGIGAVALIVALVEVAKKVGLHSKLSPILAMVIGVGLGLAAYVDEDPLKAVILGLAAGASAVGAYSGAKNVKEGHMDSKSPITNCAVCEKEIDVIWEFNGEMMCEDCYNSPENNVFSD